MCHETAIKQAILVVSFGTSHQDTRERNIGAIEQTIANRFPDWTVRRAFTSGMILRKLRTTQNMVIDTVPQALDRLAADGFDQVIIQPTHILNGEEYDDIVEDASVYADQFSRFVIGDPLLTATGDYRALAGILSEKFPQQPDQAICLMGHGTTHMSDSAYAALDYHLKSRGRPDLFVGTVEGYPDLETLLQHVSRFAPKKVLLTPLMVVAGDHAVNDMASDEPDSWKSVFSAAGYTVTCMLKGLGEYPEIRALYANHTQAAVDTLFSR